MKWNELPTEIQEDVKNHNDVLTMLVGYEYEDAVNNAFDYFIGNGEFPDIEVPYTDDDLDFFLVEFETYFTPIVKKYIAKINN